MGVFFFFWKYKSFPVFVFPSPLAGSRRRMRALPRVGEPGPVRWWWLASRARPRRAMGSSAPARAAGGRRDPGENPAVGRLRELFTGDAAGECDHESSLVAGCCGFGRLGDKFGGVVASVWSGCLY